MAKLGKAEEPPQVLAFGCLHDLTVLMKCHRVRALVKSCRSAAPAELLERFHQASKLRARVCLWVLCLDKV